ncbi:hypothetical protein EGW08_013781 [Elysia chlorotica]|uniref:KY-like immunoglobulin-like domain-containing protein n=1 Tax=Elysia chlorotica TaxID=188477 RepID=A0A433TA80_ELYCH|nr:hypothetical protein EGW08_013781 [Elysia chlorotica]
MAEQKPELPNGFIGAQPRFSELKLKTDSHKSSQIKVDGQNMEWIKLKTENPMKVVTKLVKCAGEQELPGYVLCQRKDDDEVRFLVGFPENGFYKFQIFALPENDPAENLPNVYNYLIEVTGNFLPATPFVKTYTKFYTDCCYLEEPLFINPNSDDLDDVKFKVTVPMAVKVAVHAVDEWFHLEKNGSKWEGSAALARFKSSGAKITLNANYDKDSNSYSVLLEYNI